MPLPPQHNPPLPKKTGGHSRDLYLETAVHIVRMMHILLVVLVFGVFLGHLEDY